MTYDQIAEDTREKIDWMERQLRISRLLDTKQHVEWCVWAQERIGQLKDGYESA